MAIDFPASPSVNDTFSSGGVTYTWDGTVWASSGPVGFVQKAGDTMTGDLTIPSLNDGQLAGFRNILINPTFSIYQRGSSGDNLSSENFAGDRWIIRSSASSSSATWEVRSGVDPAFENVQADHLRIVQSATTNTWGLVQRIETVNALMLQGGQVSVSFVSSIQLTGLNLYLQNSVGGSSGTAYYFSMTEHLNPYGSVGYLYKGTATIPANAWPRNSDYVGFYWYQTQDLATSTTIDVGLFQLEPGPVATPFEHRPIATELALCQRYYQTISQMDVLSVSNTGTAYSGQAFLPVVMRAVPTGVVGASSNLASVTQILTVESFKVYGNPTLGTNAAGVSDITLDAEL